MFDCKRILNEIKSYGVYGIYGLPRAGKTTLSAGIVYENNKRREKGKGKYFDYLYTTDETIQGATPITYAQFGKWNIKDNSLIILEECGLGLDCRNYKSLDEIVKRTIALIGHHKSTILWSSQTADVDKVLRVRSKKLFLVERSIFNFSLIRPITYQFGVDNGTGEMRDIYHVPQGVVEVLPALLRHEIQFINRKPYYKLFDSFIDTYKYPMKPPDENTRTPAFSS